MHELMMMLSAAMPEEMIIQQIEETIAEYKVNPTKENRGKLGMLCMIFTSKEAIESMDGGLDAMLARMDKAKKGFDLIDFDPKNTR